MSTRRGFLGTLAALFAGLFGAKAVNAANSPGKVYDWTLVYDPAANGGC